MLRKPSMTFEKSPIIYPKVMNGMMSISKILLSSKKYVS